jgi:putative serine protease PepD
MTRSRLSLPSLPVLVLAAAVVAILAFGVTRWITDSRDAQALPTLDIKGDAAAAAPGALDANKVITARLDTTVAIESTIGGEPMRGTGVVVDARQGLVVTASHVVRDYDGGGADATTIAVTFHAGDQVEATLGAIDQINDLAILKIDPSAVTNLVAAPLADSDRVVVGSEVIAIGNPLGYRWTATRGMVSVPHVVLGSRINANSNISDAIQHDAAVNTGNSGGPLFNARGELIGINQQIATRNGGSVGLSFAVASDLVQRALDQYRGGAANIGYATLGIEDEGDTVTLSPQLAKAANIPVAHGAIVQHATGPALRAQLATGRPISFLGRTVNLGDVIVGLGGSEVRSTEDLQRIAGRLAPTAPVEVELVRAGKRIAVTIAPTARTI